MRKMLRQIWSWILRLLGKPKRVVRPSVITRRDHWSVKSPLGWIRVPRDGRWFFDGDVTYPTFRPSVVEERLDAEGRHYVNHVIIEHGRLRFLNDCTHALSGRTVPVEELTDAEFAFHYLREQDQSP